MAEANPLLQDPFFSQPILAPLADPEKVGLAERVAQSQAELPPPPTGKETLADVGKSLVSGGAKGLAGTMIGAPGSIETFFAKDVPEMARSGAGYLAERADLISPQQRQEMTAQPIYAGQTPEQQKGYAAPLTGLPTYKGVTETFKPAMKAAGADILAYEPQTGYGKVASSAAEFGSQGVPGAVRTMAGRVTTGAAAGAGSEFAAMSSQDPDSEGYNRLVGALAGAGAGAVASSVAGRLFNAVKAWALPTGVAQNQLTAMVSEDIRRGLSPLSVEQLQAAAERGTPVTLLDLASPATMKKLGISAEKAPAAEAAAARYNDFLKDRARDTSERVSGALEGVIQAPLNAPALQQTIEEAGKRTRDAVYTITKAAPAAQSIPMAVIGADLIKRPIIQQAMRDATETAMNNPAWGIVSPSASAQGNLAFWDQVKRELDSKIKAAAAPAQPNESVLATAQANKSDLVRRLDAIVPEYPKARDIASETFGAASAPEAGYLYFKNMNAFKRAEANKALNSMTPEQKDSFRIGFAHSLDEVAKQPGGVSSLAKKFTSDRNFKERAVNVLGKDRYDEIQGVVLSENLLSKAKELRFIEQSSGLGGASIAGAAAGAATEAAMAGSMVLSPQALTSVVLGAAIAGGGKAFLNAMERQVAAKIVPMATDPASAQELGRLASLSPIVAQVLNKLVDRMNNKIITGGSAAVTSQDRPARATGGRTGAGAMTADMLVKAAERARKSIGEGTKSILSAPDESVVKALAIANEKI